MAADPRSMVIRIAGDITELKKNLEQGRLSIETTTSAMNKMVASFRGDKLVQAAHNVSAAILEMGGAAKLSSEQQARAFKTITTAIETLDRQGRNVPPTMRAIADELRGMQAPAEKSAGALQRMAEQAGATAAGFITGQAVLRGITGAYSTLVDGLTESVKASGEAERAHAQVAQALQQQGNAVPSVIQAYQGYADTIQRTTIYQDDAVESAQALLVTVGNVMPRDMQKALQATTDLAAGLGKELPDAAMLVAKAAEGNVGALTKAGIAIDETRVKSEGFGYVLDQITAKFGGQADAIANTYDGRLQQLANSWNNVQESIGRAITTNETVVTLFGRLNALLVTNTGELNQNSVAMRAVSEAVILTVRGVAVLAQALDMINMVRAGFVIGLRMIAITLGEVAQWATMAAQGLALMQGQFTTAAAMAKTYRSLGEAVDELRRRNDDTVQGTIDFGNAMMSVQAEADKLTQALEVTRGRTVATATATAQATSDTAAWARETVALGNAAKATAAEVSKVAAIDARRLTLAVNERSARAGGVPLREVLDTLPAGPTLSRLPKLTPGGRSLDSAITPSLAQNIMGQLPNVLQSAFQGGGNAVASVGAMAGTEIGKSLLGKGLSTFLTNNLGKTIGGLASTMVPGIGALAGPLLQKGISMLVGIGGPSAKEKEGRNLTAGFQQSFGGFDKMMNSVGDAYRQMGKTSEQAQADIKGMLDAEKRGPAATQQWIDKIQATMRAAQQRTQAIETGVGGVVQAFRAAGGRIPDSMRASIESLREMTGLTDDQRKALGNLLKDARPDFAALQERAKGFGIDLAGLGPQFAKGRIEDRAKELFDVITDLQKAGGDMGGIMLGMSDEISQLVQDSIQFGTTIPDNMKPFIENLARAGKLTDASGNAITDITGLSFAGTPLEESVQDLAAAITDLVNALRDVPGAAAAAGSAAAGAVDAGSRLVDPGRDTTFADGAATGGIVRAWGIQRFANGGQVLNFRPMGTDTVPAMLTPGEVILNAAQQRNVARAVRGGGTVVQMSAVREELAELRAEQRRLNDYMTGQFSKDMARATRDEVQKVAWRKRF